MSATRVVLEYFHPWTNATGFYVASAAGWYREAGLDVEIATFDPLRGDSLAYLAAREAEFAVFPSNRLLVRREAGEQLVGVAAINHRGMETIQTVRATGITRPRELEGRTIAYNPTPRGRAMVSHLVAADGGDPSKVIAIDSGSRELSVDDVAAGEVDATFGGYWAWDALFASLPADEHAIWPVDEIGAPPYHSYLLGAHAELLERNPEGVRAFLAATERGYRGVAEDPERALAVLERVIPYFPRATLAKSLSLIAPTWLHDGAWGVVRAELMEPYAAWLAEHGILSAPEAVGAATTTQYLPEAVAA